MRILFLSTWFPDPPDNGSKLRIYGLLRGLAEKHEITLLSFIDPLNGQDQSSELRNLCRRVIAIPARRFDPAKRRTPKDLIDPTPQLIRDTYSPEMASCIEDTLQAGKFDLVIASQLGVASYYPHYKNTLALFEEVEIGVLYEKFARATSPRQKVRHGLTWMKHRRYMADLLKGFQACTVVSRKEMQLIAEAIPGYQSLEVVPNFIDLASYQKFRVDPRPNSLIFSGPFRYFANHEAMVWFLKEVYPLIQAEVPEVSLTITGDHANLPLPPASNVTLTGFVDDIRPLLACSMVSIVPLLSGGGTRFKILDAMAMGVPVVSTSKGAEGLDLTAGKELMVADTARLFADSIVQLFKVPALGLEISAKARQLVEEKYDRAVVVPGFLDLVERLGRMSRLN